MSALRVLYDGVVFSMGACSGIYRAGSPAYIVMSWGMDFCIYLDDGSLNVRVGPWLYARDPTQASCLVPPSLFVCIFGYSLFVVGDGQAVVTALRSSLPQVR